MSAVKELENKIVTNNDIVVIIQDLELSMRECKILLNKKVNIDDYEKNLKRVENRLNSFIKQMS